MFDIRAGGLEFWGGPLLTIPAVYIYLRYIAKVSARWYLDITAPSLAWGLAITRIGCFLNGCCWGSTCVDEHDPARMKAAVPWAVRFPYGSPAMIQQYHFGQLTLPKELLYNVASGETFPLLRDVLQIALDDDGKTKKSLQVNLDAARKRFEAADPADVTSYPALKRDYEQAQLAVTAHGNTTIGQVENQAAMYGLTVRQLDQLAEHYRSKPVHPAQLYETISGLLICWLLSVMFYYRRRHGMVLDSLFDLAVRARGDSPGQPARRRRRDHFPGHQHRDVRHRCAAALAHLQGHADGQPACAAVRLPRRRRAR
jgi:hypothetical protein